MDSLHADTTTPIASAVLGGSASRNRSPVLSPAVVSITVASAWLLCLPKMIPGVLLDRGIFVSVAERLLAGDRLYQQVWDNKDPFFYYAVALARAASPLGDVALEVLWVVLAGFAARRCASLAGLDRSWSLIAGFALTPLVLTGGLVEAGYSHLPGVSVTLLAFASAVGGRWGRAGGLVAVLLLLKLVMVPVAVLPILAVAVLRREGRGALRGLAASALALALGLAVVQLRGELIPYLTALSSNLTYSQSSLLPPGLPGPLAHLARVATPRALVSAAAIVLVLLWQAPSASRERRTQSEPRFMLWLGSASSLIAAVLVLAVTGLWPQHDQILLVPAVLAVLLALTAVLRSDRLGSAPVALALAVASAVLVSDPAPVGYARAIVEAPSRLETLTTVSPEARALLSTSSPSSYARIGQNDDRGHAFGLRDWDLACPRFHQYPFDPPAVLAATAACLPRARFVIVAASAAPEAGAPVWNAYLRRVRTLLRADFTCSSVDGVEVCVRQAAPA